MQCSSNTDLIVEQSFWAWPDTEDISRKISRNVSFVQTEIKSVQKQHSTCISSSRFSSVHVSRSLSSFPSWTIRIFLSRSWKQRLKESAAFRYNTSKETGTKAWNEVWKIVSLQSEGTWTSCIFYSVNINSISWWKVRFEALQKLQNDLLITIFIIIIRSWSFTKGKCMQPRHLYLWILSKRRSYTSKHALLWSFQSMWIFYKLLFERSISFIHNGVFNKFCGDIFDFVAILLFTDCFRSPRIWTFFE